MPDHATTPPELAGATYENTVRQQAAKLRDELIKQTLEDIESWRKAVDNEWTKAHPDQANTSPIPPEEIEQYRNRVRTEYFAWVVPAFERYLTPDPDDIDPVIDTLRKIEGMFDGDGDGAGSFHGASPALSRINDVRSEMTGWEGSFKNSFIDNFLTPLQSVVPNQRQLVTLVRNQLECNKIIYIRYRSAVLELLKKGIHAAQMLNNGRDPKAELWGTLVACALGTALGAISGGWALAVTAVCLDAGGTLMQGLIPNPPETNDLSAPTAVEVGTKIGQAMSALDHDTSAEEQRVAKALNAITGMLESHRREGIFANRAGDFSVALPQLNDATPTQITGGGFRPAR